MRTHTLRNQIYNVYRKDNRKNLLIQHIRAVIFEQYDLKKFPNLGIEFGDTLKLLSAEGILVESENNNMYLGLTEKGIEEIFGSKTV